MNPRWPAVGGSGVGDQDAIRAPIGPLQGHRRRASLQRLRACTTLVSPTSPGAWPHRCGAKSRACRCVLATPIAARWIGVTAAGSLLAVLRLGRARAAHRQRWATVAAAAVLGACAGLAPGADGGGGGDGGGPGHCRSRASGSASWRWGLLMASTGERPEGTGGRWQACSQLIATVGPAAQPGVLCATSALGLPSQPGGDPGQLRHHAAWPCWAQRVPVLWGLGAWLQSGW